MNITKREFLKRLGLGGAAVAAGAVRADEFVAAKGGLPPGSCGDPQNVWFGKHIFPLPHTMEDGPSCYLSDGKVVEPSHEIPVFHKTDVVVVGGGPAGFAAAVAAARAGAKVALVERYGSLGGLFTNGMVLVMLATCRKHDGRWELVTRGICEEFMDRARAMGSDFSTKRTDPERHWQPVVDPEAAKVLMDEMIEESGVEMFFHCWGVDAIQSGSALQGVVFESKQGRQAILAKQVVDCTGDADILFKAGGDYKQITHSIGFVARFANMDRVTAKSRPEGAKEAFWPLRGNEANPATGWFSNLGPKGNGLDVRDLSKAEVAHRRRVWKDVTRLRSTPGWEKVFVANTCSQIGPRASRLIDAEFVMGRKEIAEASASLPDCIGWCGKDGPHSAFRVSYRQLLPKGVDNLLCAGRCLGTGDTIDTFRLICPCFVTGQAAGVAAALAAKGGVSPRALDRAALAAELEKQKAYIG